jgi:phage terminase small subunit
VAINPATGLTDKQESFCHEFLKDFNATAAYQRAGYRASEATARKNASRLLTKGNVQAYLSELRSRVSRRAEVTLERTLQEMGRVAFSDITDMLSFDGAGVTFKDSADLPADVTAAIESVSSQTTVTKVGSQEETRVTMKAKLHNKVAALNFLADFFGIRDDFNKARATLKRYGLLLVEDSDSDTGWRVTQLDANRATADDDAATDDAIAAFSEAISPPEGE